MTVKELAEQNMRKYYGSVKSFYRDAEDSDYELKLFMDGYSKAKEDLQLENMKLRKALKAIFYMQSRDANTEINRIISEL